MDESQEESRVECGECGSEISLDQYQDHICYLYQGEKSLVESDDVIPRLIEEIQARPALWDHTLPLKKRSKEIREKMWKEIYVDLDEKYSIDYMEKKWKNLKDTFLKHLKTYHPSGSGSLDKKIWKHFDSMYFLASKNLPKTTTSNVPSQDCSTFSEEAGTSQTSGGSLTTTPTASTKRKRKCDETEELLLNILKEPRSEPPTICSALLTIQSVLDKLPMRARMEAESELINKAYSLYWKYEEDKENK